MLIKNNIQYQIDVNSNDNIILSIVFILSFFLKQYFVCKYTHNICIINAFIIIQYASKEVIIFVIKKNDVIGDTNREKIKEMFSKVINGFVTVKIYIITMIGAINEII
jgi:hypothetical protein